MSRLAPTGGPRTVAMIEEVAEHVAPDLIVVFAAAPGRMTDIVGDLEALSARWPTAIAGAGTTAALAERHALRHLKGDPVTAAEGVALR